MKFICVLIQLTFLVSNSNSATIVTNSVGQGAFRSPSWEHSAYRSFDENFARLTSVSARIFGGATLSESFVNSSTNNVLRTVSGSAEFEFRRNGQLLESFTVAPRLSNVILPGRSSTITASDLEISTITIPLDQASGNFSIRSLRGVGSNLKTTGDFTITYTYDLIGEFSYDPITATSTTADLFLYENIPAARWFEVRSNDYARINSIGADKMQLFQTSFEDGVGSYRLFADGVDYGNYSAEQAILLPSAVQSIWLSDIVGQMQSARVATNSETSNFSVTTVPEPSFLLLATLSCLCSLSIRSRL